MGRKQPNEKTVTAEIEATLGDPHYLERRDELIAMIAGLQRAESPEDVMALQLELRDRVAAREHHMADRRRTAAAVKAERNRLATAHRPEDRAVIKALTDDLELHERRHLRDRVIVHLHRCIADGLAWRATRYDRALFTILGEGTRVERFADEAGAKPERDRAQQLWDQGALPLFNDLTTVLNEGDLTVLHGDWLRPDVAVEEVKAAGRIKPGRQSHRLDDKLSFLTSGQRPADGDGVAQRLWRTRVPYRHHLDELAAIMARARTEHVAQAQVHPALLVSAVDLTWAVAHQEAIGDWTTYAARRSGWSAELTLTGSALVTRLRELRRSIPGMAPLAIFPLAAEDIADLLMGRFDYVVTLRPDRLKPEFRRRGIGLKLAAGAEADAVFFLAEREGHTVTVSAQVREQMLRELMTVETLVDVVDALLQDLRRGGSEAPPMVVCDESDAWHRAPVYVRA